MRREDEVVLWDLWQMVTFIELVDCLLRGLGDRFLLWEKLCWRHPPLIFWSYRLVNRVQFVFIGLAGDTLILLQIDLLRVFWLFEIIIIWVVCSVEICLNPKLAFEPLPKFLKFGPKLRHFHGCSDSFFFDSSIVCVLGVRDLGLIEDTSRVLWGRFILMLFLYVLLPLLERA